MHNVQYIRCVSHVEGNYANDIVSVALLKTIIYRYVKVVFIPWGHQRWEHTIRDIGVTYLVHVPLYGKGRLSEPQTHSR